MVRLVFMRAHLPASPACPAPAATEHSLLASLWLLESMESVWRSPATVCLNDYLKHLAVFSPEAVVAITADWKASFRALRAGVVDAQARGPGAWGPGAWAEGAACWPPANRAGQPPPCWPTAEVLASRRRCT